MFIEVQIDISNFIQVILVKMWTKMCISEIILVLKVLKF